MVALRERKKDQTRDALARAAFDLFQTKGYEATTVAEIARAANVSRRTFFRYYATKDALLLVNDSERLEQFKAALERRAIGETAFAAVRRACLASAEQLMQDRDRVIARAQIIESSPSLSKQERQQDMEWEQAISDALLASVHEPSDLGRRRARQIAGALWGAMRATMADWYSDGGRRDLVWLTREALSLFEGALTLEIEPGRAPRAQA
ncbi:TetR family transcriptional regulator [Pseudenhygromyxa sp. WMMC2535]|uniref:TetR family transcriptional regulator n=1 Tax=Pseudenhygromyxa sp. WMMC2535 TaxID=2712867 RepID=UPI0031F9A262